MNSRPLVEESDDPRDLSAITPFMLLTLRKSAALPDLGYNRKRTSLEQLAVNPVKRLQHVRNLSTDFWRRWSTEYLTTLQKRSKNVVETPNLQKGDMVFLTDERLAPLLWPLARVTDVFPGNDGQVRTIRVKTKTGEYNRVAFKARKLPIQVGLGSS